jgi:hypothetical protein
MSLRSVAHGPWLMVRGSQVRFRGSQVHFHRSVVLESNQDDKMAAECQSVI